jgi:hypothetical protein
VLYLIFRQCHCSMTTWGKKLDVLLFYILWYKFHPNVFFALPCFVPCFTFCFVVPFITSLLVYSFCCFLVAVLLLFFHCSFTLHFHFKPFKYSFSLPLLFHCFFALLFFTCLDYYFPIPHLSYKSGLQVLKLGIQFNL